MASCTAWVRDAASAVPVRSMSSSSDEVKSPTRLSTSGCRASRPNSGTFSRNREVLDQHANVWAKAAANIIAGVMPRERACANSASRVSASSHCQRRVLLREKPFRVDVRQPGRVREFGNALRPPVPVGVVGGLRLGFPPRHLAAVFPIAVAQFRQLLTLIELRQVGHQGAIAHRVSGLHVQIDVQARASRRAAATASARTPVRRVADATWLPECRRRRCVDDVRRRGREGRER